MVGASDAGAKNGQATIGGWFCDTAAPGAEKITRQGVHWFAFDANPSDHPWAFDKGDPQLRIAALELYGSLVLFKLMAAQSQSEQVPISIPLLTDNQGNAYSILNSNTKKWPCSAILMELCSTAHHHNCLPGIEHIKRDRNTWADDLTNHKFSGLSASKHVNLPDPQATLWQVLPTLIHLHGAGPQQPSSEPRPPSTTSHTGQN
jgi:hypothetical protein